MGGKEGGGEDEFSSMVGDTLSNYHAQECQLLYCRPTNFTLLSLATVPVLNCCTPPQFKGKSSLNHHHTPPQNSRQVSGSISNQNITPIHNQTSPRM